MKQKSDKHLLLNKVNVAFRQNEFPVHKHTVCELYVCISGSARDSVDGYERTIYPGDVFIVGANANHCQKNIKNFKCCVFQFDEKRLLKLAQRYSLDDTFGFKSLFLQKEISTFNNCHIDIETTNYVEKSAEMMLKESDKDTLDMLFTALIYIIISKCQPKSDNGIMKNQSNINNVIQFIETHYQNHLDIRQLSVASNYSSRHLSRLMKTCCGMSPMEFVDKTRIKKACELLLHTDMSISQVGAMCGFEDNNLFSRHFRKILGISPSQYRNENRQETPLTHIDVINIS